MAGEGNSMAEEVVGTELPAPVGWAKKIIPKRGGTPHKGDIVFISPTGEEIKTKRQLEQYLKSHPGGPAASEFSWATADTPRRSARLSQKSKAVEASATQSPLKKQKRSSSTKKSVANEKSNADAGNEGTAEEEDIIEETNVNVPIADTEDAKEREVVSGEALPEKPDVENAEKKDSAEPPNDTNIDNANSDVKESTNATTHSAPPDAKIEESNKAPAQEVIAGTTIVEPKETAATDAKIEESDKAPEVLADTNNVEPKEITPEAPGAQNDVSKDEIHTEEGTVASLESNAAASDQDNSKDKHLAEHPREDPALQEPPATGS